MLATQASGVKSNLTKKRKWEKKRLSHHSSTSKTQKSCTKEVTKAIEENENIEIIREEVVKIPEEGIVFDLRDYISNDMIKNIIPC